MVPVVGVFALVDANVNMQIVMQVKICLCLCKIIIKLDIGTWLKRLSLEEKKFNHFLLIIVNQLEFFFLCADA